MFPQKYVPKTLTKKDRKLQIKSLQKSQKDYKKGKYTDRPTLKSYRSKKSSRVIRARKLFDIKSIQPSRTLATKTGCNLITLKKIEKKGMGAFYSGGSRPSQTAHSWGRARLASAISGGKAAAVDYKLLASGCKSKSKALKLAKEAKQKHGHCKRCVKSVS